MSKLYSPVSDADLPPNSIMDLFFRKNAAWVKDPESYAREVIIQHGKAQWGLTLDPDATCIATLSYSAPPAPPPYPAVLMHSLSLTQAMLSNWQQDGDGDFFSGLSQLNPYREGGLPLRIVEQLDLVYTTQVYEGLYLKRDPQTYDVTTHLNIPAADFKKFVWDSKLRSEYQSYLQDFWHEHARFYPMLGKASFVKASCLQVLEGTLSVQDQRLAFRAAGLDPLQRWSDLSPDQLGASSVQDGIEVSLLMIYRYTASDILMIKDTRTGRTLLYIPGNSSPIHGFDDENSVKDWLGEQCRDPHKRRALEGHFKEVDDSDGLFLSGLHSALDGLAVYPRVLNGATGTWPPRHIVQVGPRITGDPFVFMHTSIQKRLESDAISIIHTQGDYRKEALARGVSNSLLIVGFVAMVAPEAMPLILALSTLLVGIGVDQVVHSRTLEERQLSGGRIVFGVLNALPFAVENLVRTAAAASDAAETAQIGLARARNTPTPATVADAVGAEAPWAAPSDQVPPVPSDSDLPNLRSLNQPMRRALTAFEVPPEYLQRAPTVHGPDGNLNIYQTGDRFYLKLNDKGYEVRASKFANRWRMVSADNKPGPYVKLMENGQWDLDVGGLKGGAGSSSGAATATAASRNTSLSAQVQSLYPALSDQQVSAVIADLRANGTSIEIQLARLNVEYEALTRRLDQWLIAPRDFVQVTDDHVVLVDEATRQQAAEAIKRCWRRETPVTGLAANNNLSGYVLDLGGIRMGHLPDLPCDFSHVTVLKLDRTSISVQSVNGLVRQCPNLRWLNLEHNFLVTVPEGIRDLTRLTRLMLANNNIVLDAEMAQTLASIETLRLLNLNRNPIGPLLDVSRLTQLINLFLRNTRIEVVPEGAFMLRSLTSLDLRDNRISILPEAYYERPINQRIGLLDGNPLLTVARNRIIEPLFRMPRVEGVDVWLAGTAEATREDRRAAWALFMAQPGSADFFEVINNLQGSADFAVSRESVVERVWGMLEAGVDDPALRERLISMAARPETCTDGATVIFGNMELEVLVSKARLTAVNGQTGHSLLRLARGLYRLEKVDQIARLDVAARVARAPAFREDVEVLLAYRVGLAESLELPINARHMIFASIAQVSRGALDVARQAVLSSETAEAIIDFAISRDFWVKYLEAEYVDEFVASRRATAQQMDALDDAHEMSPQTDVEYKNRVDLIAEQRRHDDDVLMRQLTQAELANGPRANSVNV